MTNEFPEPPSRPPADLEYGGPINHEAAEVGFKIGPGGFEGTGKGSGKLGALALALLGVLVCLGFWTTASNPAVAAIGIPVIIVLYALHMYFTTKGER